MSIVVMGATFVDIKGFPVDAYIPTGRNVGYIEYVHGGVSRNVVEDIANLELRPTFLGIVDESPLGVDVIKKLKDHKVNTEYMLTRPEGMGTWLAVFDNNGDVAGSISVRPDMMPLVEVLEEKGDEIFAKASSVVMEVDLEKEIVKRTLDLCEKYNVPAYGVVSNMSIAAERRDFLQRFDCFICNQGEAGLLFLDDYNDKTPREMAEILAVKVKAANIKSMVDAIPAYIAPKSVAAFERFGVFTKTELESRVEIEYETYAKTLNIEALAMIDIAGKQIIPAVVKYTTVLANSLNAVRTACPDADISVQTELLVEVSAKLSDTKVALSKLQDVAESAKKMERGRDQAVYYRDEVKTAMEALRKPVDELEMLVDKEMWPMPSYGDLIFEV